MKERRRGRRERVERPGPTLPPWLIPAALATVPILLGLAWALDAAGRHGRIAFPMDDPYIHFQFARNLATGAGFAFNPGEPTPGATSPLWVLLLAPARVFGLALEPAALALGLAAAAATVWLTWSIGRCAGLAGPFAALAALGVALSGRFVWASLSGMETCLAAALSLAVVRSQFDAPAGLGRAALTGVLAGLAGQARPEMLLIGPLAAWVEWRAAPPAGDPPRGAPWARAAVLALGWIVVAIPYTVFCLETTGRPFTNTFYAKSLVPLSGPGLAALRAAYFPDLWSWIWRDNALFAIAILPGLALWFRGARRPAAWLVWLWPVAFWAYAYALYPRHFNLSRYTIPLIPCVALLAMAPLDQLARRFGRGARRALAGAAAAILLAASAWHLPMARAAYQGQVDNIVRMHLAMAAWVDANLPASARVAMNDVGAITYLSRRHCIDTVGLVSGDLIDDLLAWKRAHGVAYGEDVLPAYFARVRPDFCILFPTWYPSLTRAPWLREIHRITYPNSTGGGNDMVVYQVVGTPGPGP